MYTLLVVPKDAREFVIFAWKNSDTIQVQARSLTTNITHFGQNITNLEILSYYLFKIKYNMVSIINIVVLKSEYFRFTLLLLYQQPPSTLARFQNTILLAHLLRLHIANISKWFTTDDRFLSLCPTCREILVEVIIIIARAAVRNEERAYEKQKKHGHFYTERKNVFPFIRYR